MKIYISADIEGVAGVSSFTQGQSGNPEYERARRLMTEEVNAAVSGSFAGGASEVTVADSHGAMQNLIAELLDPRVIVVSGRRRPLSMVDGLSRDHQGLILLGYHAAASRRGVLAHTISSNAFSRIEINGVVAGEPTLFAGHAAELGVPLLAVTGDDCLAIEIAEQFPTARSIVVKTSLGAEAIRGLTPQASRAKIAEEIRAAVVDANIQVAMPPSQPPLNSKVCFQKQIYADAAGLLPWIDRLDATTVSFRTTNYAETIRVLTALSILARD